MAQKSEQATPTPSPATTKQKTSIWKRRLGKGSKQSSNSNSRKSASSTAASASPTTVAAPLPMVAITVNGVTTAAVAATDTTEDIVKESSISPVEGNENNSPLIMDTTHQSSNYTMQDDSNAVVTPHFPSSSNHSTASYFNSIISGHRLSFSEEESTDGNGLVIQEVITTQTSFGLLESFLNVEGEAGEKWTPFGTDHDDDDVEKHVGLSSSPNEAAITTAPQQQQESSPQQQSSQSPPEQALFQVRKVDNSNNPINDSGNSSPLADPPSTQRKTLTPEFFLGSGSNNKNNTKHSRKGRKRLDTSTTFNASLATTNNHTITTTTENNNINNSSSNMSTASSSQGGHNMYAEIYFKTKPKKKPYPPPSAVSRDRSTLSSNTNPSLDMTAVSSLSGRSSMFGTVHAQENGCCAGEHPMPVTPEGCEMDYGNGNDENGGAAAALFNNQNATTTAMEEYNYFDYDANVDAPLSPQGVSPQRQLNPLFFTNHHHHGSSSSARNSRKSAANWKSKVNSLWSSVSKHTCRCLGEPFSNEDERRGGKLNSSATTAATSTTAANTSTAAVVRKMNQTPMFSTPVKTAGTFD